jgi:starvation-inducible DNA-binding protein
MYTTKNDLPEATRTKVVELCNARLAEAIDLQTQCKQAHWNVKGPTFIGLHELFDKINEDVEDYVDLIAERVVQLGDIALGTARSAAQRSQQKEYPLGISAGRDHVEAVSNALATFGKALRATTRTSSCLGLAQCAASTTKRASSGTSASARPERTSSSAAWPP